MSTDFPEPASRDALEKGVELTPRFDSNGLITAVAQDSATGDILMLAHMNAEALKKTIETGQAHYYSRSRNQLWLKGETSGQIQTVVELRTDCDQDAILLKVKVGGDGGACHVGYRSCFYRLLEKTPDGGFRLTITES
jgi:phosphoribosyl-AMP cyclohydrolase